MPVFLQDLNSLFINQANFCSQKKVKNPPNIIIPHNPQPGKPCNRIVDESTRIYFMLNPQFKKREHIVVKILMPKVHNSYMKMCLFRCDNMMVVFCVLFFLYEPMEKMVNSDISVKYYKGWILNQGNWGDNKFREPKVVHLYLNGLLFRFNWSPAPNF